MVSKKKIKEGREKKLQLKDERTPEEKQKVIEMLQALQKRLLDDAQREDGFYFKEGQYVDCRRFRETPGMKMRAFNDHNRSIKGTSFFQIASLEVIVTYALDKICLWNFHTGALLKTIEFDTAPYMVVGGSFYGSSNTLTIASLVYATGSSPIMLNLEWKETEQKTSFRPGYAHENSVKTQENIKYESEKSKNLQPGINVIKEVTGLYGHDEQITCITWSHNGKLLVMGSTDSTCSLWDKKEFKILTAFNCHEGGVTCTRFTSDDCILVTCGGFLSPEIKLWDVSEWVFGNINSMEILHDNRSKWNEALILNTSMKNTMSITIFDDLLPPIHVNHESIFDNCRKLQNKKELVLKLSQIPPTSKGDVEAKMDIHQEKDQCITSRVTAKESDDTGILSKDISPEFLPKNEENNYQKSKKSTNEDETEYSKMEVFDFEDFFDPTSILEKYPTEEVKYRLLDTNRYFIQKCSDYNTDGYFAAHTEAINGCALTYDDSRLVTVSSDRSIKFWALNIHSDGSTQVVHTIIDAHENAITACDISHPASNHEDLLCTAGKDAIVKIWKMTTRECLYLLRGHYDAVVSCMFDSSGNFVVSSGQDAQAIMWRVIPSNPEKPQKPKILAVNQFSITIEWEEPLANGSPLLHYIITAFRCNAISTKGNIIRTYQKIVEVQPKYTYKVIDGLDPGIFYEFEIAAVNQIGVSPQSEPTDPTETLAFKPSKIEKACSFFDRTSTCIRLSWRMPCPNGAPITSYTIKCIAENASEIPSREIKITLEELLKILEETTFESSYHNVIPAFILNIAASSSHTTVTDTKPNLATIEEEFSNRVSSKTKNRKGSGTLKSSHTAVTDTKPKLATIEEEFSSRASSKTKSRKGSSTLKSSQTTIRDFKPNLATIKEEFSSRASSEENEKKVATKTKKMKKAKGNDGVQPKARQPSILEKQRQEKKKRMISNLAPVNPFALEAGLPSEYTYVVKDLFPGEIYQFVVAAENRCGLAEFSPFSDFIKMDPTAPDPPLKPEIISVQTRTADVLWQKPRSNGSDILQYTLKWYQKKNIEFYDEETKQKDQEDENEKRIVLLSRTIASTKYTLSGLTPGKELIVQISASNLIANKICDSAFSIPSDPVKTLPDVPFTPEQPSLTNASSHTIDVEFVEPYHNGERITRYDFVLSVEEVQFGITATKIIRQFSVPVADLDTFFVEQIIEDDSAEALASEILGISSFPKKTQVVKKKKFTIKHLKGNIFYTIFVTAVNKIGSSDTSISSKPSSTKPPIVPALILDAPIISDIEPTKAKIRWSLPEHDGGSKIQSFWLEYSINDGTFDDGFAVYVPNEYQADFLTPKTQYRFRIAATNAVGRAIFSPPSVVFNTPSLVEFTIQTYFANRPAIEHDSARVLQRRYRQWKREVEANRQFLLALEKIIKSWQIL